MNVQTTPELTTTEAAGEIMSGAEMVVRALVDQGVDRPLRLSGRRGAADL